MKYCIECGNQLVDEAKFCNKCGAKQPLKEPKGEEEKGDLKAQTKEEAVIKTEEPEVVAIVEDKAIVSEKETKIELVNKEVNDSVSNQNQKVKDEKLTLEDEKYKSMAPSQRYEYLMQNDEAFKTVVKASKKRDLMSLANILFIVVSLVCAFMPYLVFTGNYAHHAGIQILAEEGKSIPHKFGGLELFGYHLTANSFALAPNSGVNGIYPFMVFLFGFLFLAIMILAAFLGSTRGFRLKEYEKGGIKGLIKGLGGKKNFSGILVSLFPLTAMITTYFGAKDMEYNGDTYLFGEIVVDKDGLVSAIAISVVMMIIMLVIGIIAQVMYKHKIKKYLK